jgi:uncharacterized protein YecE (DUF72 family)
MAADIRIGISGWRYPPWRGVFYPDDLTQARELEFASRALPSIELNGSFYGLQRPTSYQRWYEQTPDIFIFSIKATRYVTHILRLREIETALANFFASGLLALKEKLGPILWQFPPSFKYDAALFEQFLQQLPQDTKAAAALARHHSAEMAGKTFFGVDKNRPLRHAVEIRNASFEHAELIALLRRYKVALVVADTAGKWPYLEDVTSDFVYLRLHGDAELYASGYGEEALTRWAERIRQWSKGAEPADARRANEKEAAPAAKARDIYCYFDNDIKVRAPFDARRLLEMLGRDEGLVPLNPSALEKAVKPHIHKAPRKRTANNSDSKKQR